MFLFNFVIVACSCPETITKTRPWYIISFSNQKCTSFPRNNHHFPIVNISSNKDTYIHIYIFIDYEKTVKVYLNNYLRVSSLNKLTLMNYIRDKIIYFGRFTHFVIHLF